MKFSISLAAILIIFLAGCDVRRKDQKANIPDEKKMLEANSKPTSVQIIDSVYNFGQINEGEVVEHKYSFRNTGKNPLVIFTASAACGCTVPDKPEKPIAPGEMGFITVKFNSENKSGSIQKTVNVTSNADPEFPILRLEGDVKGKE